MVAGACIGAWCFSSANIRSPRSGLAGNNKIDLTNMPPLAYGLNLLKKSGTSTGRPGTFEKRKLPFEDDSEAEEGGAEEQAEMVEELDGLSHPKGPVSAEARNSGPPLTPKVNHNYHNLSSELAAARQDADNNIFDYDAVYDSLHVATAKKKGQGGPQYMGQLLKAAEVRKRDQLRAKEAMLLREREAEGEEFADKEKFVTAAYEAQQAEVRRLEEEERAKEKKDAERKRRGGGGMTTFYKELIDREDSRHQAALRAVEQSAGEQIRGQESDAEAMVNIGKGTDAVVNEDGQIVDKRQMLQAGLNVAKKPVSATSRMAETPTFRPSSSMAILIGSGGSKAAMRKRQSRMLEAQLEEAAKRAAAADDEEDEALRNSSKSKKTKRDVLSAKERYLQRKTNSSSNLAP